MSHQKVLLVALASIILSGCSLTEKKNSSGGMTQKEEIKQAEKMAQIMERGGSATCVATQTTEDGEQKTMMKISGKKMRVEGQEMGENEEKGFVINDGVYSYMWSESQTQGIKVKLPTEQEVKKQTERVADIDAGVPEMDVTTFDDESKYRVVCTEGKVADSEFVPPANIKFLDTEEMMKGLSK